MCSLGEGHVQKFIFTFQSFIHLINPQIVLMVYKLVNQTDKFLGKLLSFYKRDIEQIKTWKYNILGIMKKLKQSDGFEGKGRDNLCLNKVVQCLIDSI